MRVFVNPFGLLCITIYNLEGQEYKTLIDIFPDCGDRNENQAKKILIYHNCEVYVDYKNSKS